MRKPLNRRFSSSELVKNRTRLENYCVPQGEMEAVIFDGVGQIPEHAVELKAAANFLVANYGRQKIISMPQAVPKIAIFEEAARTLDIPGGVKMIQEYYRQMRKFGCNILAVVQQYDVIKDSPVRGAMIGNSKIFLKLKSTYHLRVNFGARFEFLRLE